MNRRQTLYFATVSTLLFHLCSKEVLANWIQTMFLKSLIVLSRRFLKTSTLRRLLVKIEFLLKEIAIGITPALTKMFNPSIQMVSYLYHASLQILYQFILRDQKSDELSSNFNHKSSGGRDHTLQLLLTWNIITLQCKIKFFFFLLSVFFSQTKTTILSATLQLFWKNARKWGACIFDLTKVFDSVPH